MLPLAPDPDLIGHIFISSNIRPFSFVGAYVLRAQIQTKDPQRELVKSIFRLDPNLRGQDVLQPDLRR